MPTRRPQKHRPEKIVIKPLDEAGALNAGNALAALLQCPNESESALYLSRTQRREMNYEEATRSGLKTR